MTKDSKKILVVEDETPLRSALREKFTREGFSVIEARDGEEGLHIALSEHPDLILLDIIMPKMDGLTVLKKLQEDEKGKSIPVILLTNLSDDQKVTEAIKEGVYEYLVKSDWKLSDLVKEVKAKLGISH